MLNYHRFYGELPINSAMNYFNVLPEQSKFDKCRLIFNALWCMSTEGQEYMHREGISLTVFKDDYGDMFIDIDKREDDYGVTLDIQEYLECLEWLHEFRYNDIVNGILWECYDNIAKWLDSLFIEEIPNDIIWDLIHMNNRGEWEW